MRIQILQHVVFEGLGAIADWAEANQHTMTLTRLYDDEPLPAISNFDFLVVMGGSMGTADSERYSWLQDEADFIREVAASDKPILGICLGAQLIASALGAEVRKNKVKEIGWFPITVFSTESGAADISAASVSGASDKDSGDDTSPQSLIANIIPDALNVFHWHSDMFSIPNGAQHFASSEACPNQAFVIDERIVGLQFHLEMTLPTAQTLIDKCKDQLDGSDFVQSEKLMLENPEYFKSTNKIMFSLLDQLALNAS